jgi:hypothetical protein
VVDMMIVVVFLFWGRRRRFRLECVMYRLSNILGCWTSSRCSIGVKSGWMYEMHVTER